MKKKGISLQFNWIFVLIAGFIFFMFFFSIIKNQINSDDVESLQKKTDDLNSLIKTSFSSDNTEKTIAFKEKIFFSCRDNLSEYFVGKLSYKPGRYDYDALFSPKVLDGDEIITSTLMLEVPFKIMPMLFITNKDTEYVIVNSSSKLTDLVLDLLPDASTITVVSQANEYVENNYDQVVFITSKGDYLPADFPITEDKYFAVKISSEGDVYDAYGSIQFWTFKGKNWKRVSESNYLMGELLLGAIISHDASLYNCQLYKIVKRLKLLSALHKRRISQYSESVTEPVCGAYYANAAEALESIMFLSDQGLDAIDKQLFEKITLLRVYNFDLLNKHGECPLLY